MITVGWCGYIHYLAADDLKVKRLWTDHEGEFLSNQFEKYASSEDLQRQQADNFYTLQKNEVAELRIRLA